MNRRIKKEWNRLGFKGMDRVKMNDCSTKLLHHMFLRNYRFGEYQKKNK